jgi:hypothetical protein
MLRFLRRYNKIILVFVGALLMVVFLIQGTVSMFLPGAADRLVGKLPDRPVKVAEQRDAAMELSLYQQLAQREGGRVLPILASREPLQWLLMRIEAKRMGLHVSQAEVTGMLERLNLAEGTALRDFAVRLEIASASVRRALRHWLLVQKSRPLIAGLTPIPEQERMATLQRALMMARFTGGDMQTAMRARWGRNRVSEPLLERFVYDQQARADISLVALSWKRKRDAIEAPGRARLQQLFEKHRDTLPGESEPYGFGYRKPDRVALAYLALPRERLEAAVNVPYAEVVAYYDEHPDEFRPEQAQTQPATTQPSAEGEDGEPPEPKPLAEVEQRILEKLRRQKAERLGDRMIQKAHSMLMEDARDLPRTEKGYRKIPARWDPTPLQKVADRLAEEFGVAPQVVRRTDELLSREDLTALPGLGGARLQGSREGGFAEYALTCRALNPDPENSLTLLRLQAKLPSKPLAGPDDGRYLFRITEAEPAATPQRLEAVEDAVRADARKLAAWEALKAEADKWRARVREQKLESVAEAIGARVRQPDPFSRRNISGRGPRIPSVPGVGVSAAFVDGVFALAQRVQHAEPDAGPEKRMDAIPAESAMRLVLVRLDGFQPPQRRIVRRLAGSPMMEVSLERWLGGGEPLADPFSVDAIGKRIGFEPNEDGTGARR